MLFTEGQDREYERMMREIPGHHREVIKIKVPVATKDNKDCMHCLYYLKNGKRHKCVQCIVFK